jgi:phenylalanyl-tRNA synthetase beta chain
MNNSLTKATYMDTHFKEIGKSKVDILNPLSNDLNAMRQTLLFGGLESLSRNIRHQNTNCKFYEFGNLYGMSGKEKWPYEEHSALGLFMTGRWQKERWNATAGNATFHHIHGAVKLILSRLGISAQLQDVTDKKTFNYGMEFQTKGGHLLVNFGSVNSDILESFDIEQEVFFASFNWNIIHKISALNEFEVTELSKYPSVRRDLALLVDKSVKYGRLEELAYQTERKLLKEVDLFDVYEGKGVPEGKRSYALSFILQDANSTLNDKIIDKTMGRLQQRFEREVGAELRG